MQEHIEDLALIPGWRRSRRFVLVGGDATEDGFTELLAIHEFDAVNGLHGPEHVFARSRQWRNKIVTSVEKRINQQFQFYHEFKAEDYKQPEDVCTTRCSLPPLVNTISTDMQSGLIMSDRSKLNSHRPIMPVVV